MVPGDLEVTAMLSRPISVEDAKEAKEVFLVGGSRVVMPVIKWDDVPIGDGVPGQTTLGLRQMLLNDRNPEMNTSVHIPVPYGYLTKMREQLV